MPAKRKEPMTVGRAIEILNRMRYHGRDDWAESPGDAAHHYIGAGIYAEEELTHSRAVQIALDYERERNRARR
jgi:hypothetical protein